MDFIQDAIRHMMCPCVSNNPVVFTCTCHLKVESERCWCELCIRQRIFRLERIT